MSKTTKQKRSEGSEVKAPIEKKQRSHKEDAGTSPASLSMMLPPSSTAAAVATEAIHSTELAVFAACASQDGETKETNYDEMFEFGKNLENTNPKEARHWYIQAAKFGNGRAMNAIGYLYEKGLGIHSSKVEAEKWYEKSAKAGNIEGMENLIRLLKNYIHPKKENERSKRLEKADLWEKNLELLKHQQENYKYMESWLQAREAARATAISEGVSVAVVTPSTTLRTPKVSQLVDLAALVRRINASGR